MPSSTVLGRGVRPGHQDAGRPARAHAGQLTPRLGQLAAGAIVRGPLVDEDDRRRAPDARSSAKAARPGAQLRVRGLVPRGRDLDEVGDPVAGGDERIVGGLDRCAAAG